ncbi:LOW QUALITY PROTEIN: putative gustatory receptor 98d [Drosophila gunungcola]|uniref:LOW QUALITY PROTEIN: putative gustatory receptor 98d n=1 Tax=Drosophila gunungcola TaxID=103775 RepID=UPI0022E4873D|nr:LOW QUALITY PROTEIN: putative gustatory receptor 98d [Drosophila gunungcola]
MEVHRRSLLTTARPYLHVFSIFGLTPPTLFCTRTLHKRRRGCLVAGYSCFSFAILLLVIYECYANIIALHRDLHQFHTEDFSKVMGSTQKILVVAMTSCNQLNMLLNFGRLRHIYEDMAELEDEIDNAWRDLSGRRNCWSLPFRLAFAVGLWMVVLVALVPSFTLTGLGPYLHWANKVFTEFILVMQQFKGLEYCLFVLLVYELVLRVRHILDQIFVELEDCDCRDRIQELCVALKRNQLMVGRIWKLVGEIAAYFTISMMVLFVYNGLTILHIVNWALIKSINPNDCCQYMRVGTCFLLLFTIYLSCFYSELCIKAYNSIPRILQQMVCLPAAENYSMLKMGLREYSLQMQHLKLQFNCGGFFNINLKYFGGMVVTILGYIIILVQFKIPVMEMKYRENINISEMTT